jgi:hypothetical protein
VTSHVRPWPDERGTAFLDFAKAASLGIPFAAALQINLNLCVSASLRGKVTHQFVPGTPGGWLTYNFTGIALLRDCLIALLIFVAPVHRSRIRGVEALSILSFSQVTLSFIAALSLTLIALASKP